MIFLMCIQIDFSDLAIFFVSHCLLMVYVESGSLFLFGTNIFFGGTYERYS